MSERTGLGPLETAVLRAVAEAGPDAEGWVRCDVLLDRLEGGLGYSWRVVQDLALPWRRHLPLLEYQGNLGFWNDAFGAADPEYVRVRLSRVGGVALRSERGALGVVPLGLVEGTAVKGGRRPSFEPKRLADALRGPAADGDLEAAATMVGDIASPTGSEFSGDLDALLRGERVRILEHCGFRRERLPSRSLLVLSGPPLGVSLDRIERVIAEELTGVRPLGEVGDVQNESTAHAGVRIVLSLRAEADLDAVERRLLTVAPVAVEVDRQLSAPLVELLGAAASVIRPNPTGLHALAALL